jgi:hypothetical protein
MIRRWEFLKQIVVSSIGLATFQYLPGCNGGTKVNVTGLFTPESQGVSAQGLTAFFDAVNKSELEFHSIMINRNGKTILEGWWKPFQKEYIHSLYSLSKSFTSTAAHTDIFTFSFSNEGLKLSFNNSLSLFNNDPDERTPIKARLAG